MAEKDTFLRAAYIGKQKNQRRSRKILEGLFVNGFLAPATGMQSPRACPHLPDMKPVPLCPLGFLFKSP